MLKSFILAFLVIAMSVCLAEARGRPIPKQTTLAYCETDQPLKATCACGPAKSGAQKEVGATLSQATARLVKARTISTGAQARN
jgi:hypothetical protein